MHGLQCYGGGMSAFVIPLTIFIQFVNLVDKV